MRELEATLEDLSAAWATNNGWLSRKMQYVGRRACPDHHFYRGGNLVIVEFKRKGRNKADPLQIREHKRYADAGWTVHLVNDFCQFKRILRQYD